MKNTAKSKKNLLWHTPGQFGAKAILTSFLQAKPGLALPHAFLFLGPSGIGKYKFAKEFAAKIHQSTNSAPEQYEFDFATTNSVGELRQLIAFSALTAAGNSKKIFLLRNFHLAQTSSLNILLKTLEEPAPSSLFLLISDKGGTLPTIMSRVVPVRCFPSWNETDAVGLSAMLVTAVRGYPELARDLTQNEPLAQKLEKILKQLQDAQSVGAGLVLLSQLSDLEARELQLVMQLWANLLQQNLLVEPNQRQVARILRAVQTAHTELSYNFNTKLVLQELFIQSKV
ncbi:MAG TPA: hypothetical protein PKD79_00235 [Candidatus Doudnabacteria bacterium]|nr:hypothetical protein [Candidatus Doudnabacteria bacterium]